MSVPNGYSVDDRHFVHADDPKRTQHQLTRSCWCGPTLKQDGDTVIVIHYCEPK